MVYEWDHVKDECYRLYVVEKKPLDDVIEHFHTTQNFVAR
jgi:hypothetical protein